MVSSSKYLNLDYLLTGSPSDALSSFSDIEVAQRVTLSYMYFNGIEVAETAALSYFNAIEVAQMVIRRPCQQIIR